MKNNLVQFAKVYGSISGLLYGLPVNDENTDMLLGSKIRDKDRNVVGTITEVDLDNDIWYGQVLKDSDVYKNIVCNPSVSCEIRRA